MSQLNRYLLFSVDVEPDDPKWQGLHHGGWSHDNMLGLPRLGEACRRLGVKPTFLLSHSVAVQAVTAAAIFPMLRAGQCEVGAHLHPGDTPPFGAWDVGMKDNVLRVPGPLLESKFENLHQELSSRFGRPTSYRSAAWALDARVIELLSRYKYQVDSSVTPGVSWRMNERPSYLDAPKEAYWLGAENPSIPGNTGIVEVPVSVWSQRMLDDSSFSSRFFGDLFTMPMASGNSVPSRIIRAFGQPLPRWLRPAFKTLDEMKEVADHLADAEFLHVMCHSNEVWQGTSPYARNAEAVDIFYERMEGIFKYALAKGYIPITLTGYGEHFVASNPSSFENIAARPVLIGKANVSLAADAEMSLPVDPPRKHKTMVFLTKITISAGALSLALTQVDWEKMEKVIGRMHPGIAVACLVVILGEFAINASKVTFLCRPNQVTFRKIYRFNFIKALFNNILPGGLGGEGARTIFLAREIGTLGGSTAVLISDRLTGTFTQCIFVTVSLGFFTTTYPTKHQGLLHWGAGLTASLGFLIALVIFGPALTIFIRLMSRLPGFRWRADAGEMSRFQKQWKTITGSGGRIAGLTLFCFVDQFILILILYLTIHSMGFSVAFWQISPILLMVGLSAVFPFSLGGLGVAEGAYVLAFTAVGLTPELGFLVAMLIRTLGLIPAMVGGLLFLRAGSISSRYLFSKSRAVWNTELKPS